MTRVFLSEWRQRGLALALFAVLAVAHTWPLAAAPGEYSRHDNMDAQLNEWTMAWVAHQVVRDPVHLFDAPIFYPEPRTLAFSEHLFVQGVMAMPLYWAGASPVTAFNIILLVGLTLTGWTTTLVVHRWTGVWTAAITSGCLIAFNANTLTRLVHIQAQHLEFFPIVLLALDQLLSRPRARAALILAGSFVLQALTSVYFMVFTAIAVVAAVAVRPREWLRENRRAFFKNAGLASGVALVLLTPFLLPYYQASIEQEGFTRALPEVARYSAHWANYLAAAGTLHLQTIGWSAGYASADYLFPGFTALALTLVAVGSFTAVRDRRARMALGFGLVSFALSFGPAFPLYSFLYDAFPPLQAIRGAARFGQMALAAIAILAGFGLAWLTTRLRRQAALVVGIVAIVAVNAEGWRAPIGYCGTPTGRCNAFTEVAPIFATLNRDDVKAIVIFPFYSPGGEHMLNARYMLQSTAHFKPMLNGYSGFMPASTVKHDRALRDFPSAASIDYLKAVGVTHALVDSRNMSEQVRAEIAASPSLVQEVTDGNLLVLAIR
ncbi:MAG: hypothetical protein HQ485_13150 [Acidobacteria bacterium]|nr:hypothetical protein [Acidobacteriota bacterium]